MGGKREYGSGGLDQLPNGKWRGRVRTPDGRRVTVTRDSEEACKKELRRLAGKVAGGEAVASTRHTVKSWLSVWLEESRPDLAPRTWDSYDSYIRLYVLPTIGSKRLAALRPEDVNRMCRAIKDQGLSPATALKCRAILRRALTVAQRYGHIATNPVVLTDPPKQAEQPRPWLTAEQARAVLEACADDRMRARYWLALYTGMRQGELLGLRWENVDLAAGTLTVASQNQRLTWRHGCQERRPAEGKAWACGHKRGADCPKRHGGGITARPPKSAAGRRTIPLPAVVVEELKAHRKRQAAEMLAAGPLWSDSGAVFVQVNGNPIDQSADLKAWHAILAQAKVPRMGTHAARRTAVSLLLDKGVDAAVVAKIVGHTTVLLTLDTYRQVGDSTMAAATSVLASALAAPVGS